MKQTVQTIAIILILAFVGYALFSIGGIKAEDRFKVKLDSLNKVKDSLYTLNNTNDSIIYALALHDSVLRYKVEHQQVKIIKIKEEVLVEQKKVESFDSLQTEAFYNQRYPQDTITSPIPIAKPVLISAAKDLVAYDGALKEIKIKDSTIFLQESRISLKDSTIGLYVKKDSNFKAIIENRDQVIGEWSNQYKKVKKENKLTKFFTYTLAGLLTLTLILK